MRTSKVVAKLPAREMVRMCVMGHFLPFFVHYAAHFNYDVIWLDLEHRAMDQREVQSLLVLCHLVDIDCMIRPPLSSAASYNALVNAVKFPSLGNRGIDGSGLDAGYGVSAWTPHSSYTQDANAQSFIAVQIETVNGVWNVEEIAAMPGIDCLFIGPADLGLRLRTAGDTADVSMADAVARVAAAARRYDKAWGIWPNSIDGLQRYRGMGAQMMPWRDDFGLVQVLETCSHEIEHVAATL